MKVTYSTNAWGAVMGFAGAMNNVNSAYYVSTGSAIEAISQIAKAGFEQIEIFDGNLLAYEGKEQEFKKLLEDNGAVLTAVYCAGNFIYDEILEEELYRIDKAAGFASRFGATQLVIGGGATRYNGIREDDYNKLAAALDKVCSVADKYKMTASLHPHMGSLVQSPEQLAKVMINTRMKLCPDTGHVLLGGGDPLKVIEKYLDRIDYIHLKDVTAEGMFAPLTLGTIDFDPIVNLLKNSGRPVQIAIECDGWNGDPAEGAGITFKYLEKKKL